jgi:hypothetical protein
VLKVSFNQESATERAKQDLAHRLGVTETEIEVDSVNSEEFPDMCLGIPVDDEMCAQMIASGWQINLKANGLDYNYRADKYQIRLRDFDGKNYVIES